MSSKEPEVGPTPKKREIVPVRTRRTRSKAITPYRSQDIWYDFDRMFDEFRSGFEYLLVPLWTYRPIMPVIETRMPTVDLEDRDEDYLLPAETCTSYTV
jgi:HSP20 family molecular chaperone IbpA